MRAIVCMVEPDFVNNKLATYGSIVFAIGVLILRKQHCQTIKEAIAFLTRFDRYQIQGSKSPTVVDEWLRYWAWCQGGGFVFIVSTSWWLVISGSLLWRQIGDCSWSRVAECAQFLEEGINNEVWKDAMVVLVDRECSKLVSVVSQLFYAGS